jgi:Ni,Fe-hydrogenase I large subunit
MPDNGAVPYGRRAVRLRIPRSGQRVLSNHLVIKDGQIVNYHPYPPTPWNANPRDIYGTPGPYEDAVQNMPIFEENGPDKAATAMARPVAWCAPFSN